MRYHLTRQRQGRENVKATGIKALGNVAEQPVKHDVELDSH